MASEPVSLGPYLRGNQWIGTNQRLKDIKVQAINKSRNQTQPQSLVHTTQHMHPPGRTWMESMEKTTLTTYAKCSSAVIPTYVVIVIYQLEVKV